MEVIEILNQLAQHVLAFFTIGLVVATILLWCSTRRYAKATENLLEVTKGYADSSKQMSKTMEGQKDISARQTTIMEDQTKIMTNQLKISDEESRLTRGLRYGEIYLEIVENLKKSNFEKNEDMLLIEAGLIALRKQLESDALRLVKTFDFELKEEEKDEIINELLLKGYTMETIIKKSGEIWLKKQSNNDGNFT